MRTGHLDDSAPAEYDARVFHVGALVPVAARGLDFLASARVEPPAPSGHTEEACLANTSDHAAMGVRSRPVSDPLTRTTADPTHPTDRAT